MLRVPHSFILFHLLISCVYSITVPDGFLSRPLLPDKAFRCCSQEPYISNRELPVIYCYFGSPKILVNTWQTVSVLIDLGPEQYEMYEGRDTKEVWAQFEAHRSSWSFNFLNLRRKQIRLDPFNSTCLGIRTSLDYTLRLQVTYVDYFRVALFIFGVVLFFLSPTLSDNPLFYYLTGISIGMMASVLVLFYFTLKLLPLKKPAMLGLMAGGSTIMLYFFQMFYENILVLLFGYQEYVIGYLLLSALISFIICYRFGPVSNPRSKNLIKWSLQAFALILVFFCSHFHEASLAADAVILFFYNIPVFRWIGGFMRLSKRIVFSSKPRTRLLSEEEFNQQGVVETARALDHLRDYCNSPGCRQWQTVLRLRNPHRCTGRFAKFMEGNSHLTMKEIEQYEEESKQMLDELLTDDSDSEKE